MKERIVVEYGEVNKIAELMGCTNVMVSHALAFRKNSKLARSIRKLAIERGGSKVGGNPQNTSSHEKLFDDIVQRPATLVCSSETKTALLRALLLYEFRDPALYFFY